MSANNNETYYPFWDVLSKFYSEKTSIIPTLVWLGDKDSADKLGITNKYGDVLYVLPNEKYQHGFQCTLAPFWVTKFFENDVCLTTGIDQIMLSNYISNLVLECDDNDYCMVIDDAYLPITWRDNDGASPSAYHIAKSSIFFDVFKFEDNFQDEVDKIINFKLKPFWSDLPENNEHKNFSMWGMDETYYSYKLREYNGSIKCLSKFTDFQKRRIDCDRHNEIQYDVNLLQSGWYSEIHLPRPYSNHKEYIDKLIQQTPSMK